MSDIQETLMIPSTKDIIDILINSGLTVVGLNGLAGFPISLALSYIGIIAKKVIDKTEKSEEEINQYDYIRDLLKDYFSSKTGAESILDTYVNNSLNILSEVYSEIFVGEKSYDNLNIPDLDDLKERINNVLNDKYPTIKENREVISNGIIFIVDQYRLKFISREEIVRELLKKINQIENENSSMKRRIGDIESSVSSIKMADGLSEKKQNGDLDFYISNFTVSLYLHPDNKEMNLKNLFVTPTLTKYDDNQALSFTNVFQEFINSSQFHSLILLGDAGSGKTTIISWLVYLHEEKIEFFQEIEKEMIVVRLRNIKIQTNTTLYGCICNYLGISFEGKEFFKDKYVILDGFDELYLLSNMPNWEEEIEKLLDLLKDSKLIITSRPNDSIKKLQEKTKIYFIKQFNKNDKIVWFKKYEKYISEDEKINTRLKNYIIDDEELFLYPQLMYMAVKKSDFDKKALGNRWLLFHEIFYGEVYVKEYDEKKPENYSLIDYKKDLYETTKRIAYYLYVSQNPIFVDKGEKLNTIIKEYLGSTEYNPQRKESIRSILYDCIMFCCFYNVSEVGMLEFYHNNIRDFFIAEYIYDKLENIFNISEEQIINSIQIKSLELEKQLFDLLRGVTISKEVLIFLEFRSKYQINENIISHIYDFLSKPKFKESVYLLINNLCKEITIFNKKFDEDDENIGSTRLISNFLNNVLCVFSAINNKIYLDENEITECLLSIFSFSSYQQRYSCLSIKFDNAEGEETIRDKVYLKDLIQNKFSGYDWRLASFEGASLEEVNFDNVELKGAVLNNVNMKSAHLNYAKLDGAKLNGAHLEGAFLNNALLNNVELQGAHLENANLSNAQMKSVDLSDVDLRCANLTGTMLYWCNINPNKIKSAKNWKNAKYSSDTNENKRIIRAIESNNQKEINRNMSKRK